MHRIWAKILRWAGMGRNQWSDVAFDQPGKNFEYAPVDRGILNNIMILWNLTEFTMTRGK